MRNEKRIYLMIKNILITTASYFIVVAQILMASGFQKSAVSEEDISESNTQMLLSAQNKVAQVLTGEFTGYQELLKFRKNTPNKGYRELPLARFKYCAENKQWSMGLYLSEDLKQQDTVSEIFSLYANVILICSLGINNPEYQGFEKDFEVMALLIEPGIMNTIDGADEESSAQFADILTRCPVLAPCACARLPWSKNLILIPDPYIIGRFSDRVENLLNSTELLSFENRTNKCFFSGALSGSNHPYPLDFATEIPRLRIMDMADESPEYIACNISDVNNTVLYRGLYNHYDDEYTSHAQYNAHLHKYASQTQIDSWLKRHQHKKGEMIDEFDHATYKYLLSFDGFGAAWSRVPTILATGSVLLMQEPDNTQWFYPWMKPYNPLLETEPVTDQNYIVFDKKLTHLLPIYHWLEENPEQAQQIARNGRRFAELYLTESMVNQYTKYVFSSIYLHQKQ